MIASSFVLIMGACLHARFGSPFLRRRSVLVDRHYSQYPACALLLQGDCSCLRGWLERVLPGKARSANRTRGVQTYTCLGPALCCGKESSVGELIVAPSLKRSSENVWSGGRASYSVLPDYAPREGKSWRGSSRGSPLPVCREGEP